MAEHKEQHKKSIRFFNDREVRAVWDDEHNKWWFSVLDIIAAINEQDDYQKTKNYWKYLKTKLKKENNEPVSGTNQFKIQAPDGKQRLTDILDSEGVVLLAKAIPNRFGVAVTFIALLEGYCARATPEGVSRATTRTVVVASLTVLGLDFLLTSMMFNI